MHYKNCLKKGNSSNKERLNAHFDDLNIIKVKIFKSEILNISQGRIYENIERRKLYKLKKINKFVKKRSKQNLYKSEK